MKRETVQTKQMDEGVEVKPAQQVAENAGWLVRNQDPRDSGYTGDNAPWRK